MILDEITGVGANRVILKYNVHDLDKSKMVGSLYVPNSVENAGEYQCENATVLAVGDNITSIKKGDKVIVSYHVGFDTLNRKKNIELIESREKDLLEMQSEFWNKRHLMSKPEQQMFGFKVEELKGELDRLQEGEVHITRNDHFIMEDDWHNEYRRCTIDSIYGILKEDKIYPIRGWVFCYEPELQQEEKSGDIIVSLEKKQESDRRATKMKVQYINPEDSAETKIAENMDIFVEAKFDFKFRVGDKRVYAAPIQKVCAAYFGSTLIPIA